jgi:hypothetical protein
MTGKLPAHRRGDVLQQPQLVFHRELFHLSQDFSKRHHGHVGSSRACAGSLRERGPEFFREGLALANMAPHLDQKDVEELASRYLWVELNFVCIENRRRTEP